MRIINNIRWFEAEFKGGKCDGTDCGNDIKRGDLIGYEGTGRGRKLFRFDCCGDQEVDQVQDSFEGDIEEALTIRDPRAVMPPGKSKQDCCGKCFIIHTAVQGGECW